MSSDSSPEKIMLPSRKGTMSAGSVRKRKRVLSDEEEESSCLMSSDSSPEKIMLSSRKGTMSAGSVRKRMRVLSDEEEESSYPTCTPYCKLEKRTKKESAEKVKRRLKLEELMKKRTGSSAKKSLRLDSHINISLTESNEACEHDIQEEDVHVQELPLGDNHNSSKWYQKNTQSLENFPQESCSSSVDSEEDPKNSGSQEESQQSFPSVDDDSEKEDDLGGFIVQDFEGDSQDEVAKEQLHQLIGKPTMEEAHKFYVQMMLTTLLDNEPLETAESEQWFKKVKDIIEDALFSRKNLVNSNAWGSDFKEMLTQCSVLKRKRLRRTKKTKCEACKGLRNVTRSFYLYEESNGKIVKEKKFRIGRFCAAKGLLYHRIHHYCSVELKEACEDKLSELLAVSGSKVHVSSKETVEQYCSDHQPWLRKLFKDFKKLLRKADKWAVDGKDHREMMRVISYYMH